MKPEFLPRARIEASAKAHLFEGVDISGIYDDDDETAIATRTVAPFAPALSPAVVALRQARRETRVVQARRSQVFEKAWIYSALIASFATVIGISLG